MAVKGSIKVTLDMGDSTYNISLALTGAAPSDAAPFIFNVAEQKGTADAEDLLALAIGTPTPAANPSLDLELSPPPSLLSSGSNGKVKKAAVKVESGAKPFDPASKTFKAK